MNEYFKYQFLSRRAGNVFIYKRELSTINNFFSWDIAQQSFTFRNQRQMCRNSI